jgi:hypothetical protein
MRFSVHTTGNFPTGTVKFTAKILDEVFGKTRRKRPSVVRDADMDSLMENQWRKKWSVSDP